ncbi:MAG: nicotinamide mononucleotide transporter [Vicinamibacteria bacterium]|nr:nicotinamide mononucleotide transporter [Vicinamibacteria bacterium]
MSPSTTGRGRSAFSETAVLLILTGVVAAVAWVMIRLGHASLLEGVSFVTGAACVWLTVRANIWNFPIGLVNTATFSVVFFEARLYGDAALQVVYFVLGLVGWYLWLFGGVHRTALRVVRASAMERAVVAAAVIGGTLVLWRTLHSVGGSASFWDAWTTCLSLGAQWLLTRKRLETWHLWILVDIVYVPLYISRGLNLTALLYAVFLVMAVMGLRHWRLLVAPSAPGPAGPTCPPGA